LQPQQSTHKAKQQEMSRTNQTINSCRGGSVAAAEALRSQLGAVVAGAAAAWWSGSAAAVAVAAAAWWRRCGAHSCLAIPNASPVIVLIPNGCRRQDNNQLATAAMDRGSATAMQQQQRRRRWSARRSDGNGRRCGNGHEKYNNQLAKAAMDGATAMDGDGRRNRATAMAAMAAMEDGR
jgi:hypothetical protein